MSYLERLKNKKQGEGIPTKPTPPPKPDVLSVLSVPPDANLEKYGIDTSLMTKMERYCKANISNPDQLTKWLDYFTGLAAKHSAVCLLCVSEPPVLKTVAEREQIGKHVSQTIHR